jgi:hypothetical protein
MPLIHNMLNMEEELGYASVGNVAEVDITETFNHVTIDTKRARKAENEREEGSKNEAESMSDDEEDEMHEYALSMSDALELLMFMRKYESSDAIINTDTVSTILAYMTGELQIDHIPSIVESWSMLTQNMPLSAPLRRALDNMMTPALWAAHYGHILEMFGYMLSELRSAAKCVRPATPQRAGFLYVVCDRLDESAINKPALFVIGHTNRAGIIKHFGVPGGLRDDDDRDFKWGACREFGEEVLGAEHPNVPLIIKTLTQIATSFIPLVETDHLGSFLVRVPTASLFEKTMLLNTIFKGQTQTKEKKLVWRLSGETTGLTWITLDAINAAIEHGPWMDGRLRVTSDLLSTPKLTKYITLRPFTIGAMLRNGEYQVGPAWEALKSIWA